MAQFDFTRRFPFKKDVIAVVIEFSRKLGKDEFWHWVKTIWNERDKRFGLWGHPLRLGQKVHIYGVETWSWTSALVEFTRRYCIICFVRTKKAARDKVIKAFIENIDPQATVFVGDKEVTKKDIDGGESGAALDDLARQQGVKPVQDVRSLGRWPGKIDDGFEAFVEELRHSK